MDIQIVLNKLGEFSPKRLAASFDNVGLLISPPQLKTVNRMFLTNDLTENVLDEAVSKKADFILSYHPPIFDPLKKLTENNWKERIVRKCLSEGIAVYSPHTSFDAIDGGVNDWLISAFGEGEVSPIEQAYEDSKWAYKIQFEVDPNLMANLTQSLEAEFLSDIRCKQLTSEVSILCKKSTLTKLLYAIKRGKGIVLDSIEISVLLSKIPIPNTGMGRKKKLTMPITLDKAVIALKSHLSLEHVRVAPVKGGDLGSSIESVAVCAGAGGSVLKNVHADLYITGEMRHHDVLDACHAGSSVILTDHSNCERGFLKVLETHLIKMFEGKVEIIISSIDADPLRVV